MPSSFAWSLGGELTTGANPIPVEEWLAFEQAIRTIDNTAARIRFGEAPLDQRGLEDLDVPFDSWLRGLDLPPKTRDFLMAWAGFFFGAPARRSPACTSSPGSPAFENSAVAWYVAVSEKLAAGTAGLINALAEDSEADIKLSAPVAAVQSTDDAVAVTTRAGDRYTARAAVLATPINTWHGPRRSPPSLGRRQVGHGDRSGWPGTRSRSGPWCATSVATSMASARTRRSSGWPPSTATARGRSPGRLRHLSRGARRHRRRARSRPPCASSCPTPTSSATDAHDWNADEFSQGTWMAYRPGQVMRHASALQRPEGRLTFAGSDLASGWAGWIDGAVESGHRAARAAGEVLAPGRWRDCRTWPRRAVQ